MKVLSGILVMFFISATLVSCGGGNDDVVVKAKKPKIVKVKKVVKEEVVVAKKTNPLQLDRKPFKSYLAIPANCSDGDEISDMCPEEVPPVQRFPLHSFELITVLVIRGNPRAIVRDKELNNHTVFIGTKIGNRQGKVVEIGDGRVVVEEPNRWNDDGSVANRERVELALPVDNR